MVSGNGKKCQKIKQKSKNDKKCLENDKKCLENSENVQILKSSSGQSLRDSKFFWFEIEALNTSNRLKMSINHERKSEIDYLRAKTTIKMSTNRLK